MEQEIALLAGSDAALSGTVYAWGLGVVRAIQTVETPLLTSIMKAVTEAGSVSFYLPVLLFFFWCVDEKQGFRLALPVMLSGWCNSFLKNCFHAPRPGQFDPSLALVSEASFGFPSGHAQTSLVFWFLLAAWCRKKAGGAAWIVAAFAVLLIAFTRLYLGAHFPTDILGGWFFGAAVLAVLFFAEKKTAKLSAGAGSGTYPLPPQILIAAIVSLLMLKTPGMDETLPGLFFGFCAGHILCARRLFFSAAAPLKNGTKPGFFRRALRFACGIALFFGLRYLLRAVLPGPDSLLFSRLFRDSARLWRFARWAVLGFSASFAAPWLFLKTGLASPPEKGGTENAPLPENTEKEGEGQ